jgi:hypothetical protein
LKKEEENKKKKEIEIAALYSDAIRCDKYRESDKAEGLFLKLIALSGGLFGPRSPIYCDALLHIADIYIISRRNSEEVESTLLQAVSMAESMLEDGGTAAIKCSIAECNKFIGRGLVALAAFLLEIDDIEKAEVICIKCLETTKGKFNPPLLEPLRLMGKLRIKQERYDEVIELKINLKKIFNDNFSGSRSFTRSVQCESKIKKYEDQIND